MVDQPEQGNIGDEAGTTELSGRAQDGVTDSAVPARESVDSAPLSTEAEISQADIDTLLSASGTGSADEVLTTSPEIPGANGSVFEDRSSQLERTIGEDAGAVPAFGEDQAADVSRGSTTIGRSVPLPEFSTGAIGSDDVQQVSMLNDVNLNVKIELGQARMLVEDVLKLQEGSVVELDKLAGDPVDVFVNERLVARGEVLVLNENFCVRISEVLSHDPHRICA